MIARIGKDDFHELRELVVGRRRDDGRRHRRCRVTCRHHDHASAHGHLPLAAQKVFGDKLAHDVTAVSPRFHNAGGQLGELARQYRFAESDIIEGSCHHAPARKPRGGDIARPVHQSERDPAEQRAVMIGLFGKDEFGYSRKGYGRHGCRRAEAQRNFHDCVLSEATKYAASGHSRMDATGSSFCICRL